MKKYNNKHDIIIFLGKNKQYYVFEESMIIGFSFFILFNMMKIYDILISENVNNLNF